MDVHKNRVLGRAEVADLYKEQGAALLGYAYSLVGERATAEDVLHQVFVKLLDAHAPVPVDPRPYLFRAVRNAVLNRRRGDSRHVPIEHADDHWFEAQNGRLETALALETALRTLPEDQREVVVLHVWGDMTFEEIAAVVGIPPNTAASRYRYGLAKLREQMVPAAAG
jgi:RNA polymerase sigma-70 factor (ECF subfamily)